jgi:hypothetical protein
MLDDNLGDQSSRLVEDKSEVVLIPGLVLPYRNRLRCSANLGHHAVRWIRSIRVIENLVLVITIDDRLGALSNDRSDLLENWSEVGLHDCGLVSNTTTRVSLTYSKKGIDVCSTNKSSVPGDVMIITHKH